MNEQLNSQGGHTAGSGKKEISSAGMGLAVASFVLGVLSIPLSLILIGGLCGLVGLILAIIYLAKKYPARGLAWWGLCLSAAGLLATTALVIYTVKTVKHFKETMAEMEDDTFEEWINTAAPDFVVTDIDGKSFKLSELKGKRVIVVLWATWCPPCSREIPHLIKLRNTYDVNDLVIIAISEEKDKTIRSFRDKRKLNYPVAAEKDLPSPYSDAVSIPTLFFIDRQGTIQEVSKGYHSFKALEESLRALDAKKDPNK